MAFNLPVQNFFSRTVQPTPYVRPVDWPVITDAANEVQFLMSDINDASCTIRTQFSRTSGSQNIVIDWGDGTTNTVSATVQTDTTHVYTPGTGTPCSLGYTTFKIRIYFTGTGVSVLSDCRILPVRVSVNTSNVFTTCYVLEMYYGDGTQTISMTNYYDSVGSGLGTYSYLQYAKLPSTVTFTDMSSMFNGCYNLAVVVMPTSAANLTGFFQAFTNCYSLRSIVMPSNAINITSLLQTFFNCYSLTSVILPNSLNSCTNLSNVFASCYSLKNVTVPSINNCTNFNNFANNCTSLEWVRFTNLPTFASATTVNFSSGISGCPNLQNVYFPSSCSSNARYNFASAFGNNTNLKSIVLPLNFSATSVSGLFSSCANLKRVVFQSDMPFCTNMDSLFSSCVNLTDVTLPSNVSSSGVSFTGTFANCRALESLTINSSYLFTTLASTFQSCISLKTLNWSPGVQNSLTQLSSTFLQCPLLKTINMPTSMNICNTLANCFNLCFNLESVTFPSTMNAVTTVSDVFNGCSSLVSVTLPTSMSACTNFTNMFNSCRKIQTIVLPATVSSAATAFQSTFQFCYSLKSITFPTTQMSSLTSIQYMFNYCPNLSTINNSDKLGSLTATPLVNAFGNTYCRLLSISFSCPVTVLELRGIGPTQRIDVQSVRLLNTSAGQWTGSSPQINVSYTNMSTAQLVQLFNDMAAQPAVIGKTINITGATGTAGLTAANRLIITSKGWTITG
jgi:hypothetical protein